MKHSEHGELQSNILEKVFSILKSDEHVLGIIVGGSYAKKQHDAFSDLDVGCYLRDEDRTGRETLYERVAEIAPLLCKLWIYDVNALYLYENGVRLDLDFYRASEVTEVSNLYSDLEIIYDPDDVLSKSISKSKSVKVAEHPQWFEPGDPAFIDWFFWMFRQVVCWAKRGAQDDYRSFDKLSNAISSLAEVRARLIEMHLWTSGMQDYLGRVDRELAQRMSQTYPQFDVEDIIECSRLLLKEYEYICPMYCEKSGAEYPADKVKVMYDLVTEFEQLE